MSISPDREYTKIDIAEAHLVTAIRLFFDDSHPAPIHLLAASARSILTALGDYGGVETFLHIISGSDQEVMKENLRMANYYPNFMKHADRDPTQVLSGFSDRSNDVLLFYATHDFGVIAKGEPIEMQVFQAWYYATATEKVQDHTLTHQAMIRRCISLFPGIRVKPRGEQKLLGRQFLEEIKDDEAYNMEIRRVVDAKPQKAVPKKRTVLHRP